MKEKFVDRLIRIMQLAAAVNRTNGPHVNVDFSGHVSTVDVRVYTDAWEPYAKPAFHKIVNFSGLYDDKDIGTGLDTIIGYLEEIRNDSGRPADA